MKLRKLAVTASLAAIGLSAALTAPATFAAEEQFFPVLAYRTGAYAPNGAPLSQVDGSWLPLDIWRQVKRWFASEPAPGGHLSAELASHQVVSGIAVRLAPVP